MELEELKGRLANIQNMDTSVQSFTEQEVLATFRGNRPTAIAEAEGRVASLTRQSLNVDRIAEYDKLLSIQAEIKELEMFITAETQNAIAQRKAQMEQEQKVEKEAEKETAIRDIMAEVESEKTNIETDMQNTRRALQDQKTAREKISKELVGRKEITRILTESLQVPTSSEEYKRAARSENDCLTKLRDIDKRTKKLEKKLDGLEQDYSEIDSLLKECQELIGPQKSEEIELPVEEPQKVEVEELTDEGMNDEYWDEYRKTQEQEDMLSKQQLDKELEERIKQEQVRQEAEMWADYRNENKRAKDLKQEEELAAWKAKFEQEAKEERETEERTKQEINAYDRSLKNGIDNHIDFTPGIHFRPNQPAEPKKPEGQKPAQPPKGAQQPTPPVDKKPNPIIKGQKYIIAKTGLHIRENGEPTYYAILVDEQENQILHESKKGFEDIVKLDTKEAFSLRETDGILDSKKYYDKGLANLLEEIDQMTGTTNGLKTYKEMLRNKFNKNVNRENWLDIEYDFSNLYKVPNDPAQKKKIEFVTKIANTNRLQKIVSYEKAPGILKRVFAKLFPSMKKQKLLEAPKKEPDFVEQLETLMPEGSSEEPRELTTIQDMVDYYKQAREFPEFDMELFIQDCDLTEEQAQKFRAIHERYKRQQTETIRTSYQELRSYAGFDIEQFISDYGIVGQEADIYRASHANYLKNQKFRDSLRDEDAIKKQQEKREKEMAKEKASAEAKEKLCEKYRHLYQEGFDASKIKGLTPKQAAIIQADWEKMREDFCERFRPFYNRKNFIQELSLRGINDKKAIETIEADFKEYQRREFCEMYRDMYKQRNFDPSKIVGLTKEQVQMLQEDYKRYQEDQKILADRQSKNRKKMAQLEKRKGKGATFIGGRAGGIER